MTDQTIVAHEQRLTRLECTLPGVLARLERLEDAEQQRAVDREQAERREMGTLRASADAARAELDVLRAEKGVTT